MIILLRQLPAAIRPTSLKFVRAFLSTDDLSSPVAAAVAKTSPSSLTELPSITSTTKRKPRKTKPPETRVLEELKKHFDSTAEPELKAMIATYPETLLRKKHKSPEHMYIANPEGAKAILPHILNGYKSNVPFVEVNPGIGLLTKQLLQQKVITDLRLFESHREFLPTLVQPSAESKCSILNNFSYRRKTL